MCSGKHSKHLRGFTLTEVVVVMGIVGILMSLIFPTLAEAHKQANLAQCTSNLHLISQALQMYNVDHTGAYSSYAGVNAGGNTVIAPRLANAYESYPDRLTHLKDLGYVGDPRIFVCPADYTHATKDPATGRSGLKPYYSATIPANDYSQNPDFAERDPPENPSDWLRCPDGSIVRTYNCSYIYEFSTRPAESYSRTMDGDGNLTVSWGGNSGWPSDTLVSWYGDDRWQNDPTGYTDDPSVYEGVTEVDSGWLVQPANPIDLDRDGNGIITWQEAKFGQLNNGDSYNTGLSGPGDNNIPASWSSDPYDTINFVDPTMMQRNYPRAWMPIVRCFWHVPAELVDSQDTESVLNLAVDGNVFYSSPGWEQTAWKYGKVASGFW
ncbi:MAG: prepilin-type N-terminal cleavage/methylation domain-containing protein [Planctomycetota bacterium]